MNGKTRKKLNDVGMVLRFVLPIIMFFLTVITTDMYFEIREVRKDLKTVLSKAVYRAEYTSKVNRLEDAINKLAVRIYESKN